MSPVMISADKFIDALIAAGVISERCSEFIIHAKVGQPIRLTEGKYLDDSILQIAHHIKTTDIPDEAKA